MVEVAGYFDIIIGPTVSPAQHGPGWMTTIRLSNSAGASFVNRIGQVAALAEGPILNLPSVISN